MKYLALLRAINVGGNSIIKMTDLKAAFETCGFTNVSTFIQSGNVLFESDEKDLTAITKTIEETLLKTFKLPIRVVVLSHSQFRKVITDTPSTWTTRDDMRKYIAFIKEPVKPKDIVPEIQLKEGVDFLDIGDGVLYMSTLLSGLTKSGFTKMIGKPFYKDLTIRNVTTVQKLLAKMEEK